MAASRLSFITGARTLLAVPPSAVRAMAQSRSSSSMRMPTAVSRNRPAPPQPHRTWFHGNQEPPRPSARSAAAGKQEPAEPAAEAPPIEPLAATSGAAASANAAAADGASAARIAELETEVKQLRDRLARKEDESTAMCDDAAKHKAEAEEWKLVALRERADAENTRRISREDVSKASSFAIRSFAKDVLDVPDTLANALRHADALGLSDESGSAEVDREKLRAFVDGIRTVDRSVQQVLRRHGVVRQDIEEGASIFDPDAHEAISMVPSPEHYHHAVMNVWQPGYLIGERVLRAAKVIVADNPSNPAPKKEAEEPETAK